MFPNPLLLQRFGVSWTLAKVFAIAGVSLWAMSALLFYVLFKHMNGKVRRLEPYEAGRVALGRGADIQRPDDVMEGKGVGVGVQTSFGIDDLRQAARRGDRMMFWLCPLLLSGAFLGFSCISNAAFAVASVPGPIAGIVDGFLLLMVLFPWFLAWAAIYTNIDAGTARPVPDDGRGARAAIVDVRRIEEER